MNTKKFLLSIAILIGIIAIAFSLLHHNIFTFKPKISNYLNYVDVIQSFTSGYISKNSEIIVEFNSDINLIELTDDDLQKVFSISPQTDGKVYWKNSTTLAFKPTEKFKFETEYYATIKLSKLIKNNDKEDFIFNFFIIPQSFKIEDYSIESINKDYSLQNLNATLVLSDNEDIENINKCVHVTYNQSDIPFELIKIDDLRYKIAVDSIKRSTTPSLISIKCNGESLGINQKTQVDIEIPPLDTFKLIAYFVKNYPEQSIRLVFSDPIDANQYLGGLIYLSENQVLTYNIDKNTVDIYFNNLITGNYKLFIDNGIINTNKKRFNKAISLDITFEDIKPQVKFTDNGFIIPTNSNGTVIPVLTMNLKALDVRIVQIFENNILQFLQVNNYNENNELQRVGKIIYEGTINLNVNQNDKNQWKRFYIDISKYTKLQPGAIYRINIGFRKHQTLYECNASDKETGQISQSFEYFYSDYYDDDYYYGDEYDYYDYWDNRDNPCHKAYYGRHHSVSKNIYLTDIALIAKKINNNQLIVFASNILTAEPLSNVQISLYNYQQQLINQTTTDNDGKAIFNNAEEATFVLAQKENLKSYLKLDESLSLSTTGFDVSGENINNGLKGFIYTERGVWRPGDSIYVSFMLEEGNYTLPEKQPLIFEFYNPKQILLKKQVVYKNKANLYIFRTATSPDAPTGTYLVKIKVANSTFTKNIAIETIKPNRLKIDLNISNNFLSPFESNIITLHSEWLHGSPASALKAQVEAALYPIKTTFKGFENYIFDDPTKKYYPQKEIIFSESLDEKGNASFKPQFNVIDEAPGMMKAVFTTKVFENGGEFSIDQTSFLYCPFKSLVGVNIVEDNKDYSILYTDKNHSVSIVTVQPDGNILQESHQIECKLYKLDWRWWWDQSDEYFDLNYNAQSYLKLAKSAIIRTENGHAEWIFKINRNDWGRYLLYCVDLTSGHSTGKIIYIDWPEWQSRQFTQHEEASTQLMFTTDKNEYNTNETVTVSFPGSEDGRALISIENSKGILTYTWLNTVAGINTYKFKATPEMSPNAYIYISLIQPYNKPSNDKPIRLYGIKRLIVRNPNSHLSPRIEVADALEAEKTYTIKVKEAQNKPMDYTIAIVDEGLLNLTHFKTPDPWSAFYAQEAYSVTNWDLYNYIILGLHGKLKNIISIGGDEALLEMQSSIETQKSKRFKPMVLFIGPVHLDKNSTNTHKITIPNYMGQVRFMLIARNNNEYGSFEKQVKIIKPIMIMPSLPRVLSTNDEINMPITIFSNINKHTKATVTITTEGPISVNDNITKTIDLKANKELTTFFNLKAKEQEGLATIYISVKTNTYETKTTINIYVRYPNSFSTVTKSMLVEANKSVSTIIEPIGIKNTNYNSIEISSIPSLNIEKHINYLISYPHGCAEQIISKAFPQLYLPNLSDLPRNKLTEIEQNIKTTIQKLQNYQAYQGGFMYWPGSNQIDDWITSYAGHFLIEAQKAGYQIPEQMIARWKKYQQDAAKKWYDKGMVSQYEQAYRLYTLALSGNSDIALMNRLIQSKNLYTPTIYPIAAAYAIAGKKNISEKLIQQVNPYQITGIYALYGSELREQAMAAITYNTIGNRKQAFLLIKDIAKKLSSNNWYSTHSLSFALIACSNYLQEEKLRSPMNINLTINNNSETIKTFNQVFTKSFLNSNIKQTIDIKNLSSFPVYVQILQKGIVPASEEKEIQNGIALSVEYVSLAGKTINPEDINQTTDFYAIIKVSNKTNENLSNLALTYAIPAGWEIINERLFDGNYEEKNYDYKDIRDDKVMYYFNLASNATKVFKISLNATFTGKFYHPAIICEAMYNNNIFAQLKGTWITIKP